MSECTDLEAQMRVSLLTKADVMQKMYMRDCTSEDTQSGFERARPARTEITKLLVAMRLGVTPVPIPNTMVKT